MNTIMNDLSDAAIYWHLDTLYQDLARIKRKNLSNREKQWLKGLLLGYSPKEMSNLLLGASDSDAIRPALAQNLYPLIKALMYEQTGQEIQPGRCCLPIVFERLGYRKALMAGYLRAIAS